MSQPYKELIFDQMALLDAGVDVVTSSRMMKVLRSLRKYGPLTEGILANRCNERAFLHDWKLLIAKLLEMNYIASELSGQGTAQRISLTEQGEEFLMDRLGPEPEPVAETTE